jgi:hypothetical protein
MLSTVGSDTGSGFGLLPNFMRLDQQSKQARGVLPVTTLQVFCQDQE